MTTEAELAREAEKDAQALKLLGGSVVAFIIIGFIIYSMQTDRSISSMWPTCWQLCFLAGRYIVVVQVAS